MAGRGAEPGQDGQPPGQVVGRGYQGGHQAGTYAGHEDHREVDFAQQEDEDLADGEHDEHDGLVEQVDDVAGRQEQRGPQFEDDDDGDEADDHRQDAAVPRADLPPPRRGVLRQTVGDHLGGRRQGASSGRYVLDRSCRNYRASGAGVFAGLRVGLVR